MSTEQPNPGSTSGGPPPQKFGPLSEESKQMGMLCHLLGALTCVIGPLILWLVKKDEDAFVNDQGKEATNFQITIAIGYIGLAFIGTVLTMVTFGCFFIGPILPFMVWPFQVIFGIMGALKAKEGEAYRYPVTIRFIN